jgi:hypothetical protein
MTIPTRIQLSDSDRAMIRRRADKTGYVGLVDFRGPRGRKYRGVHTGAKLTLELAENAVAELRGRRWAHGAYVSEVEYVAVNQLGEVIA